jgi:hypothetical protein
VISPTQDTISTAAITIAPEMAEAYTAFLAELPELLQTHYGQWAAFHRSSRVAVAATQKAALEQAIEKGFDPRAILVQCAVPPLPDLVDTEELLGV